MRLLIYNIAYGTGAPKSYYDHLNTAHRYLRTSHTHLEQIIKFIKHEKPDILGLVEVDTGSYRTKFINQVEKIATHLNHYHQSSVKYNHRLTKNLPILRNQANAVLTRAKIPDCKFHFFSRGFKKLIIEVDIEGIRFFLVHLALQKSTRKHQISHLAKLAKGPSPVIIAGDFNTFSGLSEIEDLKKELDLVNPNSDDVPTFPSWLPIKQLDFILCSRKIKIIDFRIPEIKHSDHLPIILDFEI